MAETVNFGDAASLVLGTLFAEPLVTGILIIVLAPLVIMVLISPPTTRTIPPITHALFLAGFGVVGGTLVVQGEEWWILIGTVLTTGALAAMRALWRHGVAHRTLERLMRSLGILAVIGGLIMAATVSTPWKGLERIETDSRVIHGYVLQTPSGFLKVLTKDTREIVIVISSTVTSRQVVTS